MERLQAGEAIRAAKVRLTLNMVDLHPKIDELATESGSMKRIVGIILILVFVLGACGTKPYYKTAKGKKKQKYYNDIQFGGKSASEMKMK